MPTTPLTLWLGGVAANVTYAGRSGCCIGEDQINFSIPPNAPTGCAVPLAVQIGTLISNYVVVPIATGSRSCTLQNTVFSGAAVQALTQSAGPINYASIRSGTRDRFGEAPPARAMQDFGFGQFAQISVNPANQPSILSSLDTPPLGTCTTSTSNASGQPLFTVIYGD